MKCSQPKDTAVRHQDHIHEEPTEHNTSDFQQHWTAYPFSRRNGPNDHTAGNLFAFPIVLPKKKAAVQNGISHACARPQKDNQAFSTTEKNYPWTPVKALWASPFPSLSRGQCCYRLTGLCLPKRLLTLGGRANRLECRGAGERRSALQTLIQNTYNQACGETLLTKTLLRTRLCSWPPNAKTSLHITTQQFSTWKTLFRRSQVTCRFVCLLLFLKHNGEYSFRNTSINVLTCLHVHAYTNIWNNWWTCHWK